MKRSAAFTLIELLIVMAILGVLVTMLVPVITGQIEKARRTSCQASLHAIGRKMVEYAHAHKGRFPCWGQIWTGYDKVGNERSLPFVSGAYGSNSRSLWLLVREDYLPADAFRCISDPRWHDVDQGWSEGFYDFKDAGSLSYSYNHSSIHPTRTNVTPTMLDKTSRALIADRIPLLPAEADDTIVTLDTSPGLDANSPNHGGDGQNVLFPNGRVTWTTTPLVGVLNDNIWTYNDGTVNGRFDTTYECGKDALDSICVP